LSNIVGQVFSKFKKKHNLLGKFIAGDFIAIAGEMRRKPASNENTAYPIFIFIFLHETHIL
jgi:hypothetical protein